MSGHPLLEDVQNVVVTGLAIVLPVLITLYLIYLIIDFLGNTVSPAVGALERIGVIGFFRQQELISLLIETGVYPDVIGFLSELIAVLLFTGAVLAVGTVARYRHGEFIVNTFDYLVASIPGVGTVYKSLRRVSNMLINETAEEFETVKLLELLGEDTYVIAFQTNPSPGSVADATEETDVQTFFVPMTPNPVTGGFLVYVPSHRVTDVDMTVDEAVRTILTSGIANDTSKGRGIAGIESPIEDTVLTDLVEGDVADSTGEGDTDPSQ